MKRISRVCLLVLLAVFGGCTSMPHPEGKPLPAMTFKHLATLPLGVQDIRVEIQETENATGFSFALDEMVRAYLQRKFKPEGVSGVLVAALDKSVVKSKHVKASNSAAGFLGVGGYDSYDVHLKLRLEHLDSHGNRVYGTVVNAKRTINVSEHASIAERESAQFEGLETLFVELDKHVEKVVVQDMELRLPGL